MEREDRDAQSGERAAAHNSERKLPDFVGRGEGPGDVAENDESILRRELPEALARELTR
jgi:hypothetical protein